jgi:hypothetical protein
MRITHEAARELIKSEMALKEGLPSPDFLDEVLDERMSTLREYGFWKLSKRIGISYTPTGVYELETEYGVS